MKNYLKFFLLFFPFFAMADFGGNDAQNLAAIKGNTDVLPNISVNTDNILTRLNTSNYLLQQILDDGINADLDIDFTSPSSAFNLNYMLYTGGDYSLQHFTSSGNYSKFGDYFQMLYSVIANSHNASFNNQYTIVQFLKKLFDGVSTCTNTLDKSMYIQSGISNLVSLVLDDNIAYHDAYTNLFHYSYIGLSNGLERVIAEIRNIPTNDFSSLVSYLSAISNYTYQIWQNNSIGFGNTTNLLKDIDITIASSFDIATNYFKEVFGFPTSSVIIRGPTYSNVKYGMATGDLGVYDYGIDANLTSMQITIPSYSSFGSALFNYFNFLLRSINANSRTQVWGNTRLKEIEHFLFTNKFGNVSITNIVSLSNAFDRSYNLSDVVFGKVGYLWSHPATNADFEANTPYNGGEVELTGDFFVDVVKMLSSGLDQRATINTTLFGILHEMQSSPSNSNAQAEADELSNSVEASKNTADNAVPIIPNIDTLPSGYQFNDDLDSLFANVELPDFVSIEFTSLSQNYRFIANIIDPSYLGYTIDIRPYHWVFRIMRACSIITVVSMFILLYCYLIRLIFKIVWIFLNAIRMGFNK